MSPDAYGSNRAPLNPIDVALVGGVLLDQPAAIVEFVERMGCVPRILASRNARLGSPLREQDLPDLVQDTLVVIWKKLPDFQGRSSLETWVYRICCLELMNAIRRGRRSRRELVREEELFEREEYESQDEHGEYEALYQALERLKPEENDVIRLKHFGELTFDQIGKRLGISDNTAKTRYYRGLKRLQASLSRVREEAC